MPSSVDALEAAVRASIHRAVANGATPIDASALDGPMSSMATRDLVYRCAIGICDEDAPKRRRVGQLLLTYASGFPPSHEHTVQRLLEACSRFANPHDSGNCPFATLREVIEGMRHPSAAVPWPHASTATNVTIQQRATAATATPPLLRQSWMQPPVHDSNRKLVAVWQQAPKEVLQVAEEKRRELADRSAAPSPLLNASSPHASWSKLSFTVACCKDYVDQQPLSFSEQLFDQQMKILGTYYDGYKSNAFVVRASSFLLKVWCDAYVSKLPLAAAYVASRQKMSASEVSRKEVPLLRLVTTSFLPSLFALMDSEYHCVRTHVFDIVMTLAAHVQLLDSQGTLPWLLDAMEQELSWAVGCLCARQVLSEMTDDRLLTAALKCVLMVVPEQRLFELDNRVLKAFLQLQLVDGRAHLHPHVMAALTEALVCKWLLSDDGAPNRRWAVSLTRFAHFDPESCGKGDISGTTLPIREIRILTDSMVEQNGWSVEEVIGLYTGSPSAASRQHVFAVLLSLAVHRAQAAQQAPHGKEDPLRPTPNSAVAQQGIRLLLEQCLAMHLHPLTLYQSHRCTTELPTLIGLVLGMSVSRELKAFTVSVAHQLALVLERFHTLPSAVRRELALVVGHHDGGNGKHGNLSADHKLLRQYAEACCHGLPSMLKDSETAPLQRQIGKTLLLHTLRLLRPLMSENAHSCVHDVVRSVVSVNNSRVRGVMPEVIGGLLTLTRTQPAQADAPLRLCLQEYLQHEATNTTSGAGNVLRLYTHLIGGLCIPATLEATHEEDISALISGGQLQVLQSSAEFVGESTLWNLYWALRPISTAAAGRARHVLLVILSSICSQPPQQESSPSATSQMSLWAKTMTDPYPAAALVAAQRVVRMAGLVAYDKYEAVVSELQAQGSAASKLRNAYSMAHMILERILSDAAHP